jgi:hypothetical protein
MNIFSALTQFDFVNVIRRRNETASPEEGLVSASLFGADTGEYTPEIFNATNDALVSSLAAFYSRLGNTVIGSLLMAIDFDAVAETTFNFSLPIASNFTSARQLLATVNRPDVSLEILIASSDADNSAGIVSVTCENGTAGIQNLHIVFHYLIV